MKIFGKMTIMKLNIDKFASKRRSFGLIEVLVSGIVMVTVIGASVSVRQRAASESAVARHQAQAYMLAGEGIEAVRQIRDTNYLATQKPNNAAPFTKRPWTCDLTTKPVSKSDSNGPYNTCLPDIMYRNSHYGDFRPATATPSGHAQNFHSLELGNGEVFGGIFRDESGGSLPLPTWHLSSRAATTPPEYSTLFFDGGTVGSSIPTNMYADSCPGAERIFVRDGETEPTVPSGNIVMQNRRTPGEADKTKQENYRAPGLDAPPDWCDTGRDSGIGYVEYRRQVFVTPRFWRINTGGIDTNEVAGNLPKSWNDPSRASIISEHQMQVLVRVSWSEASRKNATKDNFAVLLATYLTDWRQAN